jgi:hypothetical protein
MGRRVRRSHGGPRSISAYGFFVSALAIVLIAVAIRIVLAPHGCTTVGVSRGTEGERIGVSFWAECGSPAPAVEPSIRGDAG